MSCKLAFLVLLTVAACHLLASARPEGAVPARPTRPEKFSSQKEVNEYVRKLQEFYAISGRGRSIVRRDGGGFRKPFNSTQELRDYLDALNQRYGIVGRGRFGKRAYIIPSVLRHYFPLPHHKMYDSFEILAQYD